MGCLEGVSPERVIRCRFVKLNFTPKQQVWLINKNYFLDFVPKNGMDHPLFLEQCIPMIFLLQCHVVLKDLR